MSESDICPFSDVERSGPDELYPDNYIAVCARNEITKGKTATTFDPYSNITRAQLMTMVVRAAPLGGFTLEQPTNEYYSDSRHIFRNFEDANHGLNARIAEVNGLLWGIRLEGTGTWDPWKKATRGEVAQVLWRLRQKAGSGATTTTSTTGPTTTTSSTTTSSTTTTLVTSDGYESLGGTLLSGPAVAAPGVGHLAVFVRGSGGTLWTKQYKDNGWSTWQDLGGQIASDPAAISWGEGRIDVFWRGSDSALKHQWWDGSSWSGVQSLGGVLLSGPAVSSRGQGQLEVFVSGPGNRLWCKLYMTGAWSPWYDLGGELASDPAAISWGEGRIDVFVRGVDNALWHRWRDGQNWHP